jgi:DNA-binding MarR family transcriptional regulator
MRCWLPLSIMFSLLVCSASVQGQEKAKKKDRPNAAVEAAFALPKEIELTAEQNEKVAALKKEYTPKLTELSAKVNAVLTDEQKKARQEASKKAKDDGKKGKEAKAAVDEALKLTPEQKKQMDELQPKLQAMQNEVREKVTSLLTDDQKSKLPKRKAAKKAKAVK